MCRGTRVIGRPKAPLPAGLNWVSWWQALDLFSYTITRNWVVLCHFGCKFRTRGRSHLGRGRLPEITYRERSLARELDGPAWVLHCICWDSGCLCLFSLPVWTRSLVFGFFSMFAKKMRLLPYCLYRISGSWDLTSLLVHHTLHSGLGRQSDFLYSKQVSAKRVL